MLGNIEVGRKYCLPVWCASLEEKVEALGKVKIHLEKNNVNVSVGLYQAFE